MITNKVLKLPEYTNAARLSVYLSMPEGEVSTRDIVIDALSKKKKVFVPYIHGRKASSRLVMLALSSVEDFESLRPDAWGIPSLEAESVASRENALGGFGTVERDEIVDDGNSGLDVIVMPGMAFDTSKRRLGHGRGYYDRYLQKYHELLNRTGAPSPMPHLGKPLPIFCLPSILISQQSASHYENKLFHQDIQSPLMIWTGRLTRSFPLI